MLSPRHPYLRLMIFGPGSDSEELRMQAAALGVLDLVGSNAVNKGFTNLSLGVNYKPDQRLRATFSYNRVDTETLNVQAQAFFNPQDRNLPAVQNEAYLLSIATNSARASLSAALGDPPRFEATAPLPFR